METSDCLVEEGVLKHKPSSVRMVVAGIIANLPGLSAGLSMGFSAILIPQLQDSSSEIPITLEEGSWIASLFVIGDLVGCTVGGPIADRFGRRLAILVDCIPLAVGWILTWQSQTLTHLYIARAITGIGIGAGVPIASMYLREISTPELRGTLTILMPAAANTGNMLMYIFGYFLAWRTTCIPGCFIPLLPLLLVYYLPETPIWLLKRDRKEESIANLSILRSQPEHQLKAEIKLLEQIIETERQEGSGSMRDKVCSLISGSVLRPMALLVFLFFTQSFSGSNMVSYYTVTIFQMAKIPLNENLAAILVASQYVFGYILSSFIVTRLPRRVMLFSSLLLMGLANAAAGLALFSQRTLDDIHDSTDHHISIIDADHLLALDQDQDYFSNSSSQTESTQQTSDVHPVVSMIPVISCICITFGYGCGLGPVPFILFGELFPSSVRGTATSITAFLRSITVFLSIKIFPSLLDNFGISGSFISCAIVCFTAIVVCYVIVPETKGMDTQELEAIYHKIKDENKSVKTQVSTTSTVSTTDSTTSETTNLVQST